MTDADGLLAARFAATYDHLDTSDWADVRRRVARRPSRRKRVLVVALAAAAILAPIALSGTVRTFLGLHGPTPDYDHARLEVSSTTPDGRIARLWSAPSTQGGECRFTTIGTTSPQPPTGAGLCTEGTQRFTEPISWEFAHGSPWVLSGRFGKSLHAARVDVRFHGGSRRLVTNGEYFEGSVPELGSPSFTLLPLDIVVRDAAGRVTKTARIPTSFLYDHWKQVEPKLRAYRNAHGCNKTPPLWKCSSR